MGAAVAVRSCRQAEGCTPWGQGVEARVNGTERVSPLGSEVGKSVKVPKEGVGVDKLGLEVGWIEGAWVEEVSREVEFSWRDEFS